MQDQYLMDNKKAKHISERKKKNIRLYLCNVNKEKRK